MQILDSLVVVRHLTNMIRKLGPQRALRLFIQHKGCENTGSDAIRYAEILTYSGYHTI